MKNIHILPTDKPSRLILQTNNELRLSVFSFKGAIASGITQNIYITSDEEIKEGDWVLSFLDDESYETPFKIEEIHFNCGFDFKEDFKKVILTTDQDLIADGVQSIDDEFLEWFVKNPSCEDIFVTDDYEQVNQDNPILRGSTNVIHKYKIIIPKEELKQETIEESAEKWIRQAKLISNRESFISGAKCQQEQDKNKYSEEEVKELLKMYRNSIVEVNPVDIIYLDKWFEKYKKK